MYTQIMGGEPASVSAFVHDVLKTTKGHNLAIAGNLVGFLFASPTNRAARRPTRS